MAENPGPKIAVAFTGRKNKENVDVLAYIPQKTVTKLKLTPATELGLTLADVRGSDTNGRKYPKGARANIHVGKRVQIDFGETTTKGNPDYTQVTIPNSVSLITFIEEIKDSGANFVRYHGNRNWYPVPGAEADPTPSTP